jgi:cytochrome o ubiquinol oxidase subunit 2
LAAQTKKNLKKLLYVIISLVVAELIVLSAILLKDKTFAVLEPAGTIASQQKDLMIFAAILSLFVIMPVFVLLFFILWRFRDGNVKAKYRPNWDGSRKLETIWWGIPILIILVLATVTWKTSHSLDPYRSLKSDTKPLTVQVIALQWKWLFIYPEQNIATVNYLKIPEDTPVNFEITSDAPMNSFWIPQLGGQVYAMSGMQTELHLMADHPGQFTGSSANISGEGFSGMTFNVDAVGKGDFSEWVETVWQSPDQLTKDTYATLAKPTKNDPIMLFGSRDPNLYESVIMKYMHAPAKPTESTTSLPDHTNMEGMDH